MATAEKLIDVDELQEIPDPPGATYELHQGHLFAVTFPKYNHVRVQDALLELLRPFAAGRGRLRGELAFRALPHHELRAADVGFVTALRDRCIAGDDYLYGAPELVIEVLSPSNRKGDMAARMELCLANGCLEFWTVDPKQRTVVISRPGGNSAIYRSGEVISLTLPSEGTLAVDDIFAAR